MADDSFDLRTAGARLLGRDNDEVNSPHAGLMDNYLYVALTRTTTFLGVTDKKAFPREISIVKNAFKNSDWTIQTPANSSARYIFRFFRNN